MHLTGKQRRYLRAQGHGLKPLVWIGKHGVVPTLVQQLDACLTKHELVKVKLLDSCPVGIEEAAAALADAARAAVAQTLGHTALLYRAHPEHPVLVLPAGAPASIKFDDPAAPRVPQPDARSGGPGDAP